MRQPPSVLVQATQFGTYCTEFVQFRFLDAGFTRWLWLSQIQPRIPLPCPYPIQLLFPTISWLYTAYSFVLALPSLVSPAPPLCICRLRSNRPSESRSLFSKQTTAHHQSLRNRAESGIRVRNCLYSPLTTRHCFFSFLLYPRLTCPFRHDSFAEEEEAHQEIEALRTQRNELEIPIPLSP